ncbi:MAG TPA: lipid-A-disaccharide synthase [Candidatus Acidoferrales bacterium]|nr:lipid-A-disaccharide synthase [Candidatus Acidoferrales bacterium]
MTLRVAIVAGELSGDQLGGALAASLYRQTGGRVELTGVAGPSMRAAGVRPLADCRELAVMGLAEVIRHVPRLMRLRHELLDHFLRNRPDVFIGIDAPDFNLGLERRLHAAGIRTVHYVSPSVWAWRQGRIRGIRRSVDAMLTLLPFEAEFYRRHGVPVRFVGHPLADRLPDPPDRMAARRRLGLPETARLIGLLPGSRRGEIDRLAEPFLAAARWVAAKTPDARFLLPLAHADLRELIEAMRARVAPEVSLQVLEGGAHDVLEASDAAWVASGTATLEAMLLGCPMVVGYRLAPFTYALARHLVRTDHVALPNLLAGERLVPELIQDAAMPQALGTAMQRLLDDPGHGESLRVRFAALRGQLRAGGAEAAADAVLRVARGWAPE